MAPLARLGAPSRSGLACTPSSPAQTRRPPGCRALASGALGTGISRSVPLPVPGASQVAPGEPCTSGQSRRGGGGVRCRGGRAPVSSPAWDSHVTPGPVHSGQAQRGAHGTAEEFRLMAVLHHGCQPALPPGASPSALCRRKKATPERKTKRKGQAVVHPPWLQHGGSHISAAVAEGSIPASGAPGSGASSSGQRPEPRGPRWTHSQAPVRQGHEGGSRSGAHGPTLAQTPAFPVASLVEGRSGMGRAFPPTRVTKHPQASAQVHRHHPERALEGSLLPLLLAHVSSQKAP